MAIPSGHKLRLPVLRALSEAEGEVHLDDLVNAVCERLNISREDQEKYLPGRPQTKPYTVVRNRVRFACLSLKLAEWIQAPETKEEKKKRGYTIITDEGRKILSKIEEEGLEVINDRYLENSRAYREYLERRKARINSENEGAVNDDNDDNEDDNLTEKIEKVFEAIQSNLREEILQKIVESEPELLEKLSIKLMNAMGYGEKVDSTHTGRSGDGGVDAIVKEDSLGLGVINIQTKRYTADNHIQPAAIREFSGTLRSGVSKGVFITTSSFTRGAREEAKMSNGQIILIDGNELARLMIKHGVGVKNTREPMNIQEVDDDYFEDL